MSDSDLLQIQNDDTGDKEIADSLFQKGLDFLEQGSDAKAISAFDEIDRRFGDQTEVSLSSTVANALLMKSFLLKEADQAKVLQTIIQRFGNQDEVEITSSVCWAFWSLGRLAEEQGRIEEAQEKYREVVQRCGQRKDSPFVGLLE